MKTLITTLLTLTLISAPTLAAQPKKKTPTAKKPTATAPSATKPQVDGGQSRGTTQVAGGDGVFGTVYTLNDGFNFTILSTKYTIESHNDYDGTMAQTDEKLLWITFAVKNSDKDRDLSGGGLDVTLVDDHDQNFTPRSGSVMLTSRGRQEISFTLKPGQGLGQDPTKDELSCAIAIPAKAKIVKIILNQGRKNVPDEKVVRYTIAGNPGGSPKNVIAPLPRYAADPTDPTGSTVANPATAILGKFYPDGYFAIRLDSVELSSDTIYEKEKPEEGKTYAIFTFTGKNSFGKIASTYDLTGQNDAVVLRDADGEKYKVAGDPGYAFRKAKRDELFESTEIEVGEEFSYRYFFLIPKDAKPASITFGQGKYGHVYKINLDKP